MSKPNEILEWEEGDPWLMDQYGGRPITPRVLTDVEDEDFARISATNFVFEPLVWMLAGWALHGSAWNSIWDIMGYWMVLFVMLPLRLMDTDRPRDFAFRAQYVALQLLALAGGCLGWWLAGGRR